MATLLVATLATVAPPPTLGMCDVHRGECAQRSGSCTVRAHQECAWGELACGLLETVSTKLPESAPLSQCPSLPPSAWPCECVPHSLAEQALQAIPSLNIRRLDSDAEHSFVRWFVFVGWLAPLCFLVLIIKIVQDIRVKGCKGWLDSCAKTSSRSSRHEAWLKAPHDG